MPSAPMDGTIPPQEAIPAKTKALALLKGQLRNCNGSITGNLPEFPLIVSLSFMPEERALDGAARNDFAQLFGDKERRNLLLKDFETAWWVARSANSSGHIVYDLEGDASQWRKILAEAAVNSQKIDDAGRGSWGSAKSTAFALLVLHEL